MKEIIIKRHYEEDTKEILRKIKPYTPHINTFDITFNESEFVINWVYSGELIEIKINSGAYNSQILKEIIEALSMANKNIYFHILGGKYY